MAPSIQPQTKTAAAVQPSPKTATTPSQLSTYGLSPAQLRAMVSAEVAAQLGPERSMLRQDQAGADKGYGQSVDAINNLTKGYQDVLSTIAPHIQDAYNLAGNETAAFGKGFTDVIQHVLNGSNQGDQALLGVAGAPAGQSAAVTGDLTAPADSLYAMHGDLPATLLASQGAHDYAAAEKLPAAAAARGLMDVGQIHGAQEKTDTSYRQKLATLLASIPTLRTNAENNILRNARADQATALMEQRYGLQAGKVTGVDPVTGQVIQTPAQTASTKAHGLAIGRRDRATRALLTKLGTWVDKQQHLHGAVVIGHEPTMRTVSGLGGLKQTEYLTPHGWVVAAAPPKDTIQKPLYNQHGSIPFDYARAKSYVTQQLTAGLAAYGYKPADIAQMVETLLGPPPNDMSAFVGTPGGPSAPVRGSHGAAP